MPNTDTTTAAFFESKYHENPDPWNFAASPYEQNRYDAILHALAGRRYARAFEPGCSIGVLTERLAPICDAVEAVEISPSAAAQAMQRCRHLPHVHVQAGGLTDAIPAGDFDLIVLSEIGYYFHDEHLREISIRLVDRLRTGGTLLAAHWLGFSKDHLLSGDRVHEILGGLDGLYPERSDRHTGFRLDTWSRA